MMPSVCRQQHTARTTVILNSWQQLFGFIFPFNREKLPANMCMVISASILTRVEKSTDI